MTPDVTANQQAVLQELLVAHHADQYTLPPLSVESELLRKLKEFLNPIFERLEQYLRELFKGGGDWTISEDTQQFLLQCFWVLVAVIAVFSFYHLVRAVFGSRKKSRDSRSAGPPHTDLATDALPALLDSAEKGGNWPLALRIRWRLFLRKLLLVPATTPHEMLSSPPVDCPELANSLNHGMFSADSVSSLSEYSELSKALSSLEGEKR